MNSPHRPDSHPPAPRTDTRPVLQSNTRHSSRRAPMKQQELEGGLEVLEADLAEIENSVCHLVRSNVELSQARSMFFGVSGCSVRLCTLLLYLDIVDTARVDQLD